MKTITVLSDTHGNRRAIDKLSVVLAESDYINGNCDPVKLGEDEIILQVEGVKIFAAHGHMYSVKTTLSRLEDRAKQSGCAVALYGHTHCAEVSERNAITLINPGAMSRFARNSYCYLVINGDKITHKIVETQ